MKHESQAHLTTGCVGPQNQGPRHSLTSLLCSQKQTIRLSRGNDEEKKSKPQNHGCSHTRLA
jgi:hypothetical protein